MNRYRGFLNILFLLFSSLLGSCGVTEKGKTNTPTLVPKGLEKAIALLEEKGSLTRGEFVSLCEFGQERGSFSTSETCDGRIGIIETWGIGEGTNVKTTGYSLWVDHSDKVTSEMIRHTVSGKILDGYVITNVEVVAAP